MSILDNRYEIHEQIGTGGFATVYRATEIATRKIVAVKQLSLRQIKAKGINEQRVLQEVRIHKKLFHRNVIRLYDALENDEYVYVITEYCAHGDMRKYLERFGPLAESLGGYSVRASISPRAAAQVIEQCMRGTQYLHEHNVIHRDLSTGNVLIAAVQPQFLVKIGDFGLATFHTGGATHKTMCGTPNFMSPEMILKEGHDKTADIFSLGALLYALLTGHAPFGNANQVSETLRRIVAGHTDDLPTTAMSSDARELIKQLMHPNKTRRISLNDALQHRFLTAHRRCIIAPSMVSSADSGRYSMSSLSAPGSALPTQRRRLQSGMSRASSVHRTEALLALPPTPHGMSTAANQIAADRALFLPAASTRRISPNPLRTSQHIQETATPPPARLSRRDVPSQSLAIVSGGGRCRSLLNTGACCGTCGSTVPTTAQRVSARSQHEHHLAVSHQQQIASSAAAETSRTLPIINTTRLRPIVRRSPKAILRITTNGDVWGEFLSSKQPDRITLAMTITGDGQTVVVFRPTNDDCTARDDRPPAVNASTLEKFTPATLPLAYDAKYTFLATHIDRLRSETAKVTLYSSTLGKCVLYENGFVRVFCPDGVECECSGDTVQAFRRTSATDRIATTVSEQRNEDVKRARTMVLSIEHALEAVDGTHSHGFPAVCGRRPNLASPNESTPAVQSSRVISSTNGSNENAPPSLPTNNKSQQQRRPLVMSNNQRATSAIVQVEDRTDLCQYSKLSNGAQLASARGEHVRLYTDERVQYSSPSTPTRTYRLSDLNAGVMPDRVRHRLVQLMKWCQRE